MSFNYEPNDILARIAGRQSASEQKDNNLKGFKEFYLKAKARIWP